MEQRTENINFTVDAGIINRLGLELVSKSETAVSELIKNSYDADANNVKATFLNAKYNKGGTLIIEDDGLGMSRNELIDGFMRLATTDKLNNPISIKYRRPKAGRKGIGRFSTQRLGEKLIVITQKENSNTAFKLSINWNDYSVNKEVSEIKNLLLITKKNKKQGTTLIIKNLRDKWSNADVKRVYRYISSLIQPNFLKVSNDTIIKENKDEAFDVSFFQDYNTKPIADAQIMMFDKAVAVYSGFIDENGIGHCKIEAKKFNYSNTRKIYENENNAPFKSLIGSKIAFQIFYFIWGDRTHYYKNITKAELNAVKNHFSKNGGVKLYRNGFKVPPYGDGTNDWLDITKSSRIGKGIPFSNKHMSGLVQITDSNNIIFEEVAGREGIIEKETFLSLQSFISNALQIGFTDFVSFFKKTDEYKEANKRSKKDVTSKSVTNTLNQITKASKTLADTSENEEQKEKAKNVLEKGVKDLLTQTNTLAGELEMLRVLAGVGLTIGEFIHEIKQFAPSFDDYLNSLLYKNLGSDISDTLNKMKIVFTSFNTYTAFFDTTISQNVVREINPIDLRDVVDDFIEIIQPDIKRRNIKFENIDEGWDLITIPMHVSEWNTILQNLYSNSKKAIIRQGGHGKILIKSYKNENSVFISFYDNGDGISEKKRDRIFDAFYTTSMPVKNDIQDKDLTGSGLGLHIVKQIIINRNGKIWVDEPINEFNTCITIQLPLNKKL